MGSVDAVLETTSRTFRELRTRFRGALIEPGDAAYAETRRIWNAAIDRRPALIARCVDADDVIAALRFARDHDLSISVRGSGHGAAGNAVADGPIMIDLSQLKGYRSTRQRDKRGLPPERPGANLILQLLSDPWYSADWCTGRWNRRRRSCACYATSLPRRLMILGS